MSEQSYRRPPPIEQPTIDELVAQFEAERIAAGWVPPEPQPELTPEQRQARWEERQAANLAEPPAGQLGAETLSAVKLSRLIAEGIVDLDDIAGQCTSVKIIEEVERSHIDLAQCEQRLCSNLEELERLLYDRSQQAVLGEMYPKSVAIYRNKRYVCCADAIVEAGDDIWLALANCSRLHPISRWNRIREAIRHHCEDPKLLCKRADTEFHLTEGRIELGIEPAIPNIEEVSEPFTAAPKGRPGRRASLEAIRHINRANDLRKDEVEWKEITQIVNEEFHQNYSGDGEQLRLKVKDWITAKRKREKSEEKSGEKPGN